jgi:hypothetical protein
MFLLYANNWVCLIKFELYLRHSVPHSFWNSPIRLSANIIVHPCPETCFTGKRSPFMYSSHCLYILLLWPLKSFEGTLEDMPDIHGKSADLFAYVFVRLFECDTKEVFPLPLSFHSLAFVLVLNLHLSQMFRYKCGVCLSLGWFIFLLLNIISKLQTNSTKRTGYLQIQSRLIWLRFPLVLRQSCGSTYKYGAVSSLGNLFLAEEMEFSSQRSHDCCIGPCR